MEQREQQVETAVILMEAAVKIYKTLGMSKEDAWDEVMRNRPSDTPSFIDRQMESLFDASWENVDA